ncbi:MAG: alpha/beta hydrolase [Bacteroidetes bacterium]|nr:alpha/beta hydrolase [Bacteroidota bacterium]
MRISDAVAKKEFADKGLTLETNYFDGNNFKLHYVITGNDTLPTLFFVHGSPGSWDAYKQYLEDSDLLKKFRIISIDRPGFGYSKFGDAMNLEDQSRIIYSLIEFIYNGKPLFIIGHSLGGPLAVQIVADHPDKFSGMVLLAAAIDPDVEPKEKWRGFLFHTPFQYLLPGAFRPSNTEIWYLKKDLISLKEKFSKITCNVWVIHGDKDTFVPVGNAVYSKKMLINAKSVNITILKNAPHFIPWEPWYKDVKLVLLNMN